MENYEMKKPGFIALLTAATVFTLGACNVVESPIMSSNDGQDRNINVVNDSGWTIAELRARNTETGRWTKNLLSGTRLRSGQSISILIDDGSGVCEYTLRTTYLRGYNQTTEQTYNFCRSDGLNYGPN